MREHELKTHPEPFDACWDGYKRHEIRTNDRDYQKGDVLHLREYDPATQTYSGRKIVCAVTYITLGGTWGLPEHVCVMTIREQARVYPSERMRARHLESR